MLGKAVIGHRLSPDCGMHPYGEGKDPKGQPIGAINVRCIEEIDLTKMPVAHFDGRSRHRHRRTPDRLHHDCAPPLPAPPRVEGR